MPIKDASGNIGAMYSRATLASVTGEERGAVQAFLQHVLIAALVGLLVAIGLSALVARSIAGLLAILTDGDHAALGETGYDIGEACRRKVQRKDGVGRIETSFMGLQRLSR